MRKGTPEVAVQPDAYIKTRNRNTGRQFLG